MIMYDAVLRFWFEETPAQKWWIADPVFDAEVRARFGGLLIQALQGELADWREMHQGRLAEIIVLDQFSRNIYRGTPQAFSQDPMALALSQEAWRAQVQQSLSAIQMSFALMPFMHSESRKIHEQAEALFRELAPRENFEFELKHKAIIDRFGRYPHRNAVLGRVSTAAELEFLKQPGSAF
jgi:uncharacterized protein (DUF924 family)